MADDPENFGKEVSREEIEGSESCRLVGGYGGGGQKARKGKNFRELGVRPKSNSWSLKGGTINRLQKSSAVLERR